MVILMSLPDNFTTEEALDSFLATPSPQLINFMRHLKGDIMLLGVSGKMGITMALLAKEAIKAAGSRQRVIGVSRFSDTTQRDYLSVHGIETIACDFLSREQVAQLPAAENIIFLAGRKFGTEEQADLTWATNTLIPCHIAESCFRSRIVAFSTGCVYPLVTSLAGGCRESDEPCPVGEYAQSCLGRERIFQYTSRIQGTPVCLFRLNYAIDLRYGVLHDIAQTVWQDEVVSLAVPFVNVIWQGDANTIALLALGHCASPASILNVTGPETLSVRVIASEFSRLMGKQVTFTDEVGTLCYLNDASRALGLFGYPRVPPAQMIQWVAQWVMSGRRSLSRPTHFIEQTGRF